MGWVGAHPLCGFIIIACAADSVNPDFYAATHRKIRTLLRLKIAKGSDFLRLARFIKHGVRATVPVVRGVCSPTKTLRTTEDGRPYKFSVIKSAFAIFHASYFSNSFSPHSSSKCAG